PRRVPECHDLHGEHPGERQGGGRGESADPGPDRAFSRCDLQVQRPRTGLNGGHVMRRLLMTTVVLVLTASQAPSADINAFVSTAIKAATDEILPPFERANGHTIRASYAPSGALLPRFERGEPVDIFLTDAPALDQLIKL